MFANAFWSLASSTVADAACSLICAGLLLEHLRRGLDQRAGRLVQRRDLVEDELLVGQGLGHDHRGPQRATRSSSWRDRRP